MWEMTYFVIGIVLYMFNLIIVCLTLNWRFAELRENFVNVNFFLMIILSINLILPRICVRYFNGRLASI